MFIKNNITLKPKINTDKLKGDLKIKIMLYDKKDKKLVVK